MMSFLERFQKQILGSLITATVGMIAFGAYVLWPQYQVFALIQQLRSPDVDVRRWAADRLGDFGPVAAEGLSSLTTALEDEDTRVRFNAAIALCRIEPRSAIAAPVLLDFLSRFEPSEPSGCRGPTVIDLVAGALKGMGQDGVPHLTNALADDRPLARYWACYILGWLEADAAGRDEALIRAMDDEDNLVRLGAATALWRIRHDAELTFPVLRDVFGDRNRLVQLGKSLLLHYLESESLPVLVATMEDADPWTRRVAITCIADLREQARSAAPALVLASRDVDSGVREVAVSALGCIHAESSLAVPALIASLDDEIDAVRECAAWALRNLGMEADPATDALTRASTDRAHRVREAALAALESIRFAQSEAGIREKALPSKTIRFWSDRGGCRVRETTELGRRRSQPSVTSQESVGRTLISADLH